MKIKIPKISINLLAESMRNEYSTIGLNPIFSSRKQFNYKRIEDRVQQIVEDLKLKDLEKKKVLEIGSGSGMFTTYLKKSGVDIFGLEPDHLSYVASLHLLKENKLPLNTVTKGFGEKIPFNNNSFDLLVSFQVLEHTQNPRKVLQESLRVLKKGGYGYFVLPNYYSFWEGHYALPWLPFFTKAVAKAYVKIFGRDPSLIDSLNFLNPFNISDILKEEQNAKLISTGKIRFLKRINSTATENYWSKNKLLVNFVKVINYIKISKFVGNLLASFNMHYPLVIIFKKVNE